MNKMKSMVLAAAASALLATGATAQDVTLKLHHFLPPQANVPKLILDVWRVIDGVDDIGWTVVGYTPGRYPSTEVFELPFMVEDARAASCAYWTMFEEGMADGEFKDVKILGTWVHGPGMFHTMDPVEVPADLEGMKIRGGSRLVNDLLTAAGATPVGMPVPAVAEALSKGVIDGTTIPWEVTPALKVPELVENHTEFEGTALYTLTFVLAMNKAKYEGMSAENQAVMDANSGMNFSVFAGGIQSDADGPAREVAVENGNNIITVSDTSEWKALVSPIYDSWTADLSGKGHDGQALIDRAKGLMSGECAGATGAL